MSALKRMALVAATVCVVPALVSFAIRAALLGRDRALQGSSQALSLVPGIAGQYLRRAFFCRVLDECHASVTIEFGTLLSRAGARLGEQVYVGPHCHLGLVHLERDVLIAAGVHVPSGRTRTASARWIGRSVSSRAACEWYASAPAAGSGAARS